MTGRGSFLGSFVFAFRGLGSAWAQERNFRVQCAYAAGVGGLLLWLRPDPVSGLLVVLVMTILLAAELMNSALERTVDLCVSEFHPLAGSAKDLAASSVLVVAVASAAINLRVFFPLVGAPSQPGFAALLLGALVWRFGRGR